MKWTKIYIIIFIIGLLNSACSDFQKVQKSGTFEERYNLAVNYFNKKDYYRASLLLDNLLPLAVGRQEAEKIEYYYAFCQFYEKQYMLSSYYFKKFTETYSRSELTEECHFMHALSLVKMSPASHLDQTNTHQALDVLQNFLNQYPYSTFSDSSNTIIEELHTKLEYKAYKQVILYYKLEDYKAAVIAVENFKRNFPDADYNEELAFVKLDAQYNLAKISLEKVKKDGKTIELKKERFEETITFYNQFIDYYQNSKYIKQAEVIYQNTTEKLKELN